MSWDNDAAGYLAELSRSPGGVQPATIGEVWNSEWKRTALDTIGGVGQPFGDARADLVTAIEGASGRPIADYAAQMGVKLGAGVTQAEDIRLLGSLADTLPDDKRKSIEPLKDVRLNAAKKAQKIEADAEEIGSATYGLTAHATAFIAGVARQAADPVNVAAMVATAPLGAARGAAFLATIGREAGANAVAQAVVEPIIEPQRERLGLESGFGRAAGNVLEAGIGGAALSGLFHVAGRGLRSLRGEHAAESTQAPAAADGSIGPVTSAEPVSGPDGAPAGAFAPDRPIEQFAPDDFHAAGDLAERDHIIDAMSPLDTAEGRLDHAAGVDVAARAIETGQSVSDMLTREGVRMSPMVERLSELQLGEIAQHATALEQRAAVARGTIDTQLARLDEAQVSLEEKATLAAGLRREVDDVASDIAGVQQKLSGLDDPVTMARRQAIVDELGQPGVTAARRRDLVAEQTMIDETIAAGADRQARDRASLSQEAAGLKKLQQRNERAAVKAEAAHRTAADNAADRQASLTADRQTRDATLSSQREIVGNELRRAIATLAADGYGVRLQRSEAQDLADFVLLAKPEEMSAALAEVTETLVAKAAATQTEALDRVATKLVGIARLNGRELPADVARSLALQLERADNDEVMKIIDRVVGERNQVTLSSLPFPEAEKSKAPVAKPQPRADKSPDAKPGAAVPVKPVGDTALAADAARVLEEAGGDFEITLMQPDGTARTLKASDALREVEADVNAANELNACIVGAAEEAA